MDKLYNRVNRDVLKEKLSHDNRRRITLSFYKYAHIGNPEFFRDHFYMLLDSCETLGRIYVAHEGINGQLSVPADRYEDFQEAMSKITFLDNIRHNIAIEDDGKSFFKLMIKVRGKILADGLNDKTFNPADRGQHVTAEEFNKLTDDEATAIVDMRNHYESEVGHFESAITPDVETFRESLPIIEDMLADKKAQKIVMYCTGGIRCEKASAYFKHKGFKNIFQFDGGIIEYARQVEKRGLKNKFVGKNFVFDERLGERISEEVIAHCHQCGDQCDDHTNCTNDACHILFIQCKKCADRYKGYCSHKCMEFNDLTKEERSTLLGKVEFNGTKFGKGSYKANRSSDPLS